MLAAYKFIFFIRARLNHILLPHTLVLFISIYKSVLDFIFLKNKKRSNNENKSTTIEKKIIGAETGEID